MKSAKGLFRSLLMAGMLCCFCGLQAGDLAKAFKSLNTGDYLNAKKYLLEVIADEPDNAAGNYGMAKFYFLKDNKLFNLDSANLYIKRAAKKIPLNPEDKQTKKYLTFGVRDYTIKALQQEINQAEMAVIEKQNTLESYQYFLDNFVDSTGIHDRAVSVRNQLAYIKARSKNSPADLDEFIKKYPKADQIKDAHDLYEKLLYEQTTADQSWESYKKYIDTYPNGDYIKDAQKNYQDKLLEYYNHKHDLAAYLEFQRKYPNNPEINSIQDSIYKLATASGTVESFKNFLATYKTNRNYNDAWNQLYIVYTSAATDSVYRRFLAEFPNYPEKARVNRDMELSHLDLVPFKQNGKFGYAIQPTPDSLVMVIPFDYEEAFAFKEGFAAVRSKPCTPNQCTYYYINKAADRVLPGNYNYAGDFDNGFAIVGAGHCEVDSCKYGIIDKRGAWIIPAKYDELDDPTEGLFMVGLNDKYGFINQRGDVVISIKYTNAVEFSEGLAAVAIDSNWFFIDKTGRQLFLDSYHDVSEFKDGMCAVTKDGDNWGYIDMNGTFAIAADFEDAGDFENGFAIVSKKEKDPKHKELFISQRYKIDKTGKVIEKLTAPKETTKKPVKKKRGRT